jgi:DNA-binding GntR family transcriptional regulator
VVGALPEAFRHAYEIREVVEGFTAQTAADRADESTAAEIKRAATDSFESASAGDIDGYLAADAVFHAAIAAAAGNPRAHKIIDDATSLIKALRARDLPHAHLAQIASECGQRHIRVADAIAAGDGRRAAEEMRSHLQYEERYLYAKSREGLSGAGGWLTES